MLYKLNFITRQAAHHISVRHIGGGRNEKVSFAVAKLANSLHKARIDYCVIGGNALQAHGYERATTDVDVLMTPEGLQKFIETHVGRGYAPRFEGAKTKYRNTMDDVPIDILVSGTYPGESQRVVAFPDPREISYEEVSFRSGSSSVHDKVMVVDLQNLINFKLLAYGDLPETRMQDFLDVRNLIQCNPQLNEAYSRNLYPIVRENYLKAVMQVRKINEMDRHKL